MLKKGTSFTNQVMVEGAAVLVRTALVLIQATQAFLTLSWNQDWMACTQGCGALHSELPFEIEHSTDWLLMR